MKDYPKRESQELMWERLQRGEEVYGQAGYLVGWDPPERSGGQVTKTAACPAGA